MKGPELHVGVHVASKGDTHLLQLCERVLLPLPAPPAMSDMAAWKHQVRELHRQVGAHPNDERAWIALVDALCTGGRYPDAAREVERARGLGVHVEGVLDALQSAPPALLELAAALRESGLPEDGLRLLSRISEVAAPAVLQSGDDFSARVEREAAMARDYLAARAKAEAAAPRRVRDHDEPTWLRKLLGVGRWVPLVTAAVVVLAAWLGWTALLDARLDAGTRSLAAARTARSDTVRRELLQGACRDLEFYSRQRPADVAALVALGEAACRMGVQEGSSPHLALARRALQEALGKRPDDLTALLWLGRVEAASGDRTSARTHLQQVRGGGDAALSREAEQDLMRLDGKR